MAGVDLLDDLDRGEPVVLEVNAVPGWRALAVATGVDVAAGVLSLPAGASSMSTPFSRVARAGRLPARSDGPQAGQRPPVPRLLRQPLPRLRAEHAGDRPGLRPRPGRRASAPRCSRPCGRHAALVATNTNLGMILLWRRWPRSRTGSRFGSGVERVLGSTTVDDARLVYEADPAGEARRARLGAGAGHSGEPTVTLREAMRLAAGRDSVARQYANGFADVFGLAVPCLSESLASGQPLETAIVATHLTVLSPLARHPDRPQARRGRGRGGVAARRRTCSRRAGRTAEGVALCRRVRPLAEGRGPRAEPGDDGRPRRGGLVRRPAKGDHRSSDRQGGLERDLTSSSSRTMIFAPTTDETFVKPIYTTGGSPDEP